MATNPYAREVLLRSAGISRDKAGVLISVTREEAKWSTINFSVRCLVEGQYWQEHE
jgi:hypothetical protein